MSADHAAGAPQDVAVRTLIDSIPELAWTARADGFIDFYNRRWYEYTGAVPAQMEGWGWTSVHHPDVLPGVVERWQLCLATGEPFEMEFPLRRADGVFRWFLTRVVPMRNDSGEVVRWFGTNTDIEDSRTLREVLTTSAESDRLAQEAAETANQTATQLREAFLRAALAESKRLMALFDHSPAGICVVHGEDFTLRLANPRMLELWGRTDAIVGLPLLEALPELRGQGFDTLLHGVLTTGTPYQGTEALMQLDLARDGQLTDVYLDFVCTPFHAPDGTIDGVFVHAFEVTDNVAARRRAAALTEDALRAVRAREELLAIVSHDLRNPLNTVLLSAHTMASLADDGPSGIRTKKAAKTIVKAVDRMSRLIDDLLDLAKLEGGQPLAVYVEPQDVAALVRESVELFEPVAAARQITLMTDLPQSIPVQCDGGRVQQAIANLVGNAIKFTREQGTIRVGARCTEMEVTVSVSDTGIGIPADHVPHIFEAYWQADAQRKRGAGLGLSIVKAIIDAHGGRVAVETAPGSGSTFQFTLPRAGSAEALEDVR